MGRGEKYLKFPVPTKNDLRKVAANYARRIRAIWRAEKIMQRRRPGEKSAEEYAIEILWKHFGEVAAGLDVDDVIAAGKTGGKRKPKAPMAATKIATCDEVIGRGMNEEDAELTGILQN